MKPLKVFISYAHEDESYLKEFVTHLSGLKRADIIQEWVDDQITPGDTWDAKIKDKIENTDVIMFLVSADFMASDYINDVEIKKSIEHYEKGEITIVPVVIRPCDFASSPLNKFQALPKSARPISTWQNRDEAWMDVIKGLRKLIVKLRTRDNSESTVYKTSSPNPELEIVINDRKILIKNLIADGNIEKAISELLKLSHEDQQDIQDSAILISSRYNSYKKSVNMGVISNQEANVNRAKITHALLSLLDEIK